MTRPTRKPVPNDKLELTQTIRRLSAPSSNDLAIEQGDEMKLSALLVCTDSASKKWGPRWLGQTGLQATVVSEPIKALPVAREKQPDVIIVEAGLVGGEGIPVFRALQDAADLDVPVVVLCGNTKDISAAVDSDVFDVVRKPFEWELISRRAYKAAEAWSSRKKLAEAKESLKTALDLADNARLRLRSRESYEPVTGLPNQSKFLDLLKRAMSAVQQDDNVLAAFAIGFSRFRLVIEAMGQERANMILNEIGASLSECLREIGSMQTSSVGLRTAAAASLDQGRFGMMLTCSDEAELTEVQQKIIEKLSRPVQISGQTIYLAACVGAALYPQDATDVDSLLQRADNAMRDARSRGGGFKFYCSETDAAAARKLKIEHMLHEALDHNELSLAYQPIVDVGLGKVTAAEALLRWRQSDGTQIPPGEFVPIAEESGVMIRVGEFVLDEACRQLRSWHAEGIMLPRICVNVSKVQLMHGGFVQTVRTTLQKHEVDPGWLELELSERGILSGDADVINQLHDLKDLGVRLSVDDFGTGDSAISYLKDLPVDVLKIDRSYVSGLTENHKDQAIASAMVTLGHKLDLTVIAEGVETQKQLKLVKDLGCDDFQGFLISRPVAPEQFVQLIKKPG